MRLDIPKEEKAILVLDSLSTWEGQERLITKEIVEAIKTLSKPELPSNLDEAANRQAALEQPYKWEEEQDDSFSITPLFVMSNIRSAFKAGVEWMAKQGYTEEGVAHLDDCEIWVNMTNTDIKDGDKVIVQIRKK